MSRQVAVRTATCFLALMQLAVASQDQGFGSEQPASTDHTTSFSIPDTTSESPAPPPLPKPELTKTELTKPELTDADLPKADIELVSSSKAAGSQASADAIKANQAGSIRPDSLFRALDRNGDHYVSSDEFPELEQVIYLLDSDGDGRISWIEARGRIDSAPTSQSHPSQLSSGKWHPGGIGFPDWRELRERPRLGMREQPSGQVTGNDQPQNRRPSNLRPGPNDFPPPAPGGWRGPWTLNQQSIGRPISSGYVFINGKYLSPPYLVSQSETRTLSINGQEIETPSRPQLLRINATSNLPLNAQVVVQHLLEGDVLAFFSSRPAVAVQQGNGLHELLEVLSSTTRNDSSITNALKLGIPLSETSTWSEWIRDYQAPAELQARMIEYLQQVQKNIDETNTKINAARWMKSSSYPLTVLGMALVVWAMGHILSFRPDRSDSVTANPFASKATVISALLILLLSSLDLVWTLMASQMGAMEELNPIGNQLIKDPQSLIAFKLIASTIATGLLIGLRSHSGAQRAAWWLCLVCALLTCRWLVFNSLYVT